MTFNHPSEGKHTVLITGAAGGIGRATVNLFAESGWRVIGVDRAVYGEAFPADGLFVQADISQPEQLDTIFAQAHAFSPSLDALVNNASSFFPTPLGEIADAQWEDLIGTNLKAPLFLAQAATSELRRNHGAIVNIVDIHADRPMHGHLLYSVAKAGLAALTRALAVELAASRWSGPIQITLVGFDDGLTALAPDRVSVVGTLAEALPALGARAGLGEESLAATGAGGVLTGRSRGRHPQPWVPHYVISAVPPSPQEREQLLALARTGHAAAAGYVSPERAPAERAEPTAEAGPDPVVARAQEIAETLGDGAGAAVAGGSGGSAPSGEGDAQ